MSENLVKTKIYDEIKMNILNEVYKAGDVLNERKLAEEFSVSRTPIREALKLLEREGWIKVVPWKGAIVSEISLKEIKGILEIRMILEPAIIELLENKINYRKREILDKLFLLQQNSQDKKSFMLADRKFHMTLVEWTENQQLISIVKELNDKIYMVGQKAISNYDFNSNIKSIEEHKKIIDFLKENDISKAKYYMIFHLLETRSRLLKNIENEVSFKRNL